MRQLEHKDLLDAGVHFGHLTRKWNPKMAPFIFMKQNGIHIIDLNKTLVALQEMALQLRTMASLGKKILFVATKKQAKESVEKVATGLGMPYVTERWLGGTLTNFATIRKLLKRMSSIDKSMHTTAYKSLAKKEQLVVAREQAKLTKNLQGLANVTRLPSALFVVDINKEHIAVKEAKKLGIPVFALVDTNTNPDAVDFCIPGNDDAFRSIDLLVRYLADAIKEGLEIYKKEKAETASRTAAPLEKESAVETPKSPQKAGFKTVRGVVVRKNAAAAKSIKAIGANQPPKQTHPAEQPVTPLDRATTVPAQATPSQENTVDAGTVSPPQKSPEAVHAGAPLPEETDTKTE